MWLILNYKVTYQCMTLWWTNYIFW